MKKRICRTIIGVLPLMMILFGASCNRENPTPNKPTEQPQETPSIIGTTWELKQEEAGMVRRHRYHFTKIDEVRYWIVDTANGVDETIEDHNFYYYYREDKKVYFVEHKGADETVTYKLRVDWSKKLLYLDDFSGQPELIFYLIKN